MPAVGSSARQFFSPMTFDFLWEGMGIGEHPYPLRVPSHGATVDERRALRLRVDAELRAQGIKDARGNVNPMVESWLSTLAQGTLTIDAIHIPDFKRPMISALAASDGTNAVLAVQDSRRHLAAPDPLGRPRHGDHPAAPAGSAWHRAFHHDVAG